MVNLLAVAAQAHMGVVRGSAIAAPDRQLQGVGLIWVVRVVAAGSEAGTSGQTRHSFPKYGGIEARTKLTWRVAWASPRSAD